MIQIEHVSKKFDEVDALTDLSLTLEDGKVFGMLGTNGAGKSTLMRIIAGIYRADAGTVAIDGEEVYENPEVKQRIYYISDDVYYYNNATPRDLANTVSVYYPKMDRDRFFRLLSQFGLEDKRRLKTFSKGMKKQVSILLGVCSGADYLFCDETFDGLDPVMRQAVKSLFAQEMCDRNFTPIIASHNLRELEDICDHVGLLHKGGVLLSRDLEDMKAQIHKVQYACREDILPQLRAQLEIVSSEKRGSLVTLTVRGDLDMILAVVGSFEPLFFEALPLSLEEIFISETGVIGYDVKTLIL